MRTEGDDTEYHLVVGDKYDFWNLDVANESYTMYLDMGENGEASFVRRERRDDGDDEDDDDDDDDDEDAQMQRA